MWPLATPTGVPILAATDSAAALIASVSPVTLLGLAAAAGTATGQEATGVRLACLGSLNIELMSGRLPGSRSSGLGSGPGPTREHFLVNLVSGTDQFRSLLARASRRNCLS